MTGRTLYEVPEKLRNAGGVKYIVFSDGAGIWSRENGIIKYEYFPADTAREIFNLLSQCKTFIEVYSGGKPLVESKKLNPEQVNYYHIDRNFIPEIFKSRCAVESLATLFDDKSHKTELFDVFFKYETERAECEKRLKAVFGGISVTSSMTNNLEICPPGVNKGATLTQFCGELGIDIRNMRYQTPAVRLRIWRIRLFAPMMKILCAILKRNLPEHCLPTKINDGIAAALLKNTD